MKLDAALAPWQGSSKKNRARCNYLGIDIDPTYAKLAKRYCDESIALNIENAEATFWEENADRDCWIFGDSLEHLRDPWNILRKVRKVVPSEASIVACIPNAQHWTMQLRLNIGEFRYEESGLLDKTHLRFFTKRTIFEMFNETGFGITEIVPRIFPEPMREHFLPVIENFARLAEVDSKNSVTDALPLQYVGRAVPM